MNLKKHIRLKKTEESQLTEEEQELFNCLSAKVQENAQERAIAKKVDLWKILTPIISFVGAIAITLTCIFTLRTPNDFVYNDENLVSEESSFTLMQNDIKYLDLSFLEPFENQTSITSDIVSKDKLFYRTFAKIKLSSIDIVAVINEKYDYNFELKDESVTRELQDYSITYSSVSSRSEPIINYKGWIKVQTETVYFEYLQMPALGDEAFLKEIQQIIQVK